MKLLHYFTCGAVFCLMCSCKTLSTDEKLQVADTVIKSSVEVAKVTSPDKLEKVQKETKKADNTIVAFFKKLNSYINSQDAD